jgi:hypothetical protein
LPLTIIIVNAFRFCQLVALEDRDVDGVYRAMLRQELQRPDFSKQYEYLKYRRVLVDWMAEVGETHLRMRKEYVHAAVGYLEKVLARDEPLPRKDRFQLLALSCLRISLKFQGTEEELPPMAEFWEMGNRMYSFDEISDAEADVFQKCVRICSSCSRLERLRLPLPSPLAKFR